MKTSLIAVLTALMVLAGCGQTGPLYLPGGSPAAETGDEETKDENSEESGAQQQE